MHARCLFGPGSTWSSSPMMVPTPLILLVFNIPCTRLIWITRRSELDLNPRPETRGAEGNITPAKSWSSGLHEWPRAARRTAPSWLGRCLRGGRWLPAVSTQESEQKAAWLAAGGTSEAGMLRLPIIFVKKIDDVLRQRKLPSREMQWCISQRLGMRGTSESKEGA
jgi:hypothetical protein